MPHLCFYTSISHLHRTSLSLHTTTLYTSLLSLHIIISNSQPGGGALLAHCYPDAKAPETAQKVNGWGPFFANDSQGYIAYGTGNFDGQGSGHEFNGTVWHPTHGYVNSCDGGRSHWACNYRQA